MVETVKRPVNQVKQTKQYMTRKNQNAGPEEGDFILVAKTVNFKLESDLLTLTGTLKRLDTQGEEPDFPRVTVCVREYCVGVPNVNPLYELLDLFDLTEESKIDLDVFKGKLIGVSVVPSVSDNGTYYNASGFFEILQ